MALIHCFVPAGHPDQGTAADTLLLDSPADAAARLSTTLIDLAFGRGGSIWGGAGAESMRTSDPVDFVFGITTFGAAVGTRPIARLAAALDAASDAIDMIFSGELANAA